jgi:hypothetical protein
MPEGDVKPVEQEGFGRVGLKLALNRQSTARLVCKIMDRVA